VTLNTPFENGMSVGSEKTKENCLNDKFGNEEMMSRIFEKDSTFLLLKKLMVYKLLGSNIFIVLTFVYRLFGLRLTNWMINRSVGSIFTSGENINTLVEDIN
jgi:hypothetical protein